MRHIPGVVLSLLGFLLPVSRCRAATPDTTPVAVLADFATMDHQDEALVTTNLDVSNAALRSVPNAKQLILQFFHKANIAIPGPNFSCIINVVGWETNTEGKAVAAKSNWYVYNPRDNWTNQDLLSNKRIYGVRSPYILAIHLNVPPNIVQSHFAYKYTAVHRLSANIQNLMNAVNLFAPRNAQGDQAPPAFGMWAIGALEGNPPSDITVTPAVSTSDGEMILESSNTKFDDEGFYRWDISLGIPIASYRQLQSLVDSSGQVNQANIDKRNLLVVGNFFLKPVDVKDSKFLTVPHLVGGVSVASKPLHSAMAGVGWGPVISNFYIGAMILTNNLPNHKLAHHYKLAFGLNLPMRTLASKLGLKSQIE